MKGLEVLIGAAKKAPTDADAEPSDSPGQLLLDAIADKDAAAVARAIRLIVEGGESDDEDLDDEEV